MYLLSMMFAPPSWIPIVLIAAFLLFLGAAMMDWRLDGRWPSIRLGWMGMAVLMGAIASKISDFNHIYPWVIIAALFCFLGAAFTELIWPKFRLGWLGLAFYTASIMLSSGSGS
jgi:hypothetical protein